MKFIAQIEIRIFNKFEIEADNKQLAHKVAHNLIMDQYSGDLFKNADFGLEVFPARGSDDLEFGPPLPFF